MFPSEPPSIAIVVPCYNEAERLDGSAFLRFVQAEPSVRFVFVDDGSRDATLERLRALEANAGGRIAVLDLQPNQGKAEAVRTGMLHALDGGCDMAGYWDADLATPLSEIRRFADTLQQRPDKLVVFGARVQLLGRAVERSNARHYLGRVFATAASAMLGLPIYDTQCGAKLFRAGATTRALFQEPFAVGWTFDVEIVARLVCLQRERGGPGAAELIYELPVEQWHDVAGSKVAPTDFVRALFDMNRIRRRYRL